MAKLQIQSWNQAAQKMYGWTAGEVSGKSTRDIFHTRFINTTRDEVMSQFNKDGKWVGETIQQRKNGTTLYVWVSMTVLRDITGKVIGNVGIYRDITLQRQAQEALKKSERYYRHIYNRIPTMFHSLNPEGEILNVSYYWLNTMGYEVDEVIGKPIYNFLTPESSAAVKNKSLKIVFEKGQVKSHERQFIKKNGEIIDVLASAVSEVSRDDGSLFTLAAITDITALKQAEKQLREAQVTLEQRVEERTADLATANEEIRRFVNIVSHDLRAPLINLKGFTSELNMSLQAVVAKLNPLLTQLSPSDRQTVEFALHEDVPEAIEFIHASVSRIENLVDAVLKLSRLGRRDLDFEVLDTQQVVNHVLQSLEHKVREIDAQVTCHPLVPIVGDRLAIEQIFSNLIYNALVYHQPERPIGIEIGCEARPHDIQFYVRDNGRGIAPDDTSKIFDLFRRVGRQDTQGEGMGLAYVQTLVRRHGGQIQCDSQLDEGTTFTFTLANNLGATDVTE